MPEEIVTYPLTDRDKIENYLGDHGFVLETDNGTYFNRNTGVRVLLEEHKNMGVLTLFLVGDRVLDCRNLLTTMNQVMDNQSYRQTQKLTEKV